MDVPAPARSFSLFHSTQQLEDVHAPFVFKILLICFNDIDCIDYYLFQKNILEKKLLPSTRDIVPSPLTWNPRPKERQINNFLSRSDDKTHDMMRKETTQMSKKIRRP